MRCAAALFSGLSSFPAPLLADSDCALEVSAYEAAKGSFSADAEAIYHILLPAVQFAPADADKNLLAEKLVIGEIDLSVLSKASKQARKVVAELTQMASVLDEDVNPLFLKRRQMPQVFAKGADLSHCLSTLERAEFDRIVAILSAKAAKDEARQTECIEAKASSVEAKSEQAELDAKIAELVSERDQTDDPATKDALSFAIALQAAVPELKSATDAMECAFVDSDFTAEAMTTVFGLIMTVNFSMKDRQAIQEHLQLVFGEQLDFGYFDMTKVTQ